MASVHNEVSAAIASKIAQFDQNNAAPKMKANALRRAAEFRTTKGFVSAESASAMQRRADSTPDLARLVKSALSDVQSKSFPTKKDLKDMTDYLEAATHKAKDNAMSPASAASPSTPWGVSADKMQTEYRRFSSDTRGRRVQPGDVVDWRSDMEFRRRCGVSDEQETWRYPEDLTANFGNSPNRKDPLFFGTTHVAVGHNDLGLLMNPIVSEHEATVNIKNGDRETAGETSAAPLKFVGLEQSAFSSAKGAVIAEMLLDPEVLAHHVFQVWYSTTWSAQAKGSFLRCTRKVIDRASEGGAVSSQPCLESPAVHELLHFWASVASNITVPREDAYRRRVELSKALSIQEHPAVHIANFVRADDQKDAVRYLLTGEVFPAEARAAGEIPVEGSLCMWCTPQITRRHEENIFNVVSFVDILEESGRCRAGGDEGGTVVVTELISRFLMRGLTKLKQFCVDGRVVVELHHMSVDRAVAQEIASWRPRTMSWSNVLDYVYPVGDFHTLARSCSSLAPCTHYGYSMDWTSKICGSTISDYEDHERKKTVVEFYLKSPRVKKFFQGKFRFALEGGGADGGAAGDAAEVGAGGRGAGHAEVGREETELQEPVTLSLADLCVYPVFDHVEKGLRRALLIPTHYAAWSDHFLADKHGVREKFVSLEFPNPLKRREGGTVQMGWTYSPVVKVGSLHGIASDFEVAMNSRFETYRKEVPRF